MYSFIEFYNAREYASILSEVNFILEGLIRDEKNDTKRDRLTLQQEIFGAMGQAVGQAVGGIAKGLGKAGQYGAGISAAYHGAQYGNAKRAIDALKELDEVLKEISGYDEEVRVLQGLRARLEQPQEQPQQQQAAQPATPTAPAATAPAGV